jgi:hypothetical protein
MDPISPSAPPATAASSSAPARSDVVGIETTARPTAKTVGAPFSEVLAGGARAFVKTAGAAVRSLPGSPLMAVAIRGGSGLSTQIAAAPFGPSGPADPVSPFGPGAGMSTGSGLGTSPTGTTTGSTADGSAAGTNDPSIASTLAQDQEMNLYYLQIQEQVNAQNRTYSALSNVIEVEHNTAKTAIGNIH